MKVHLIDVEWFETKDSGFVSVDTISNVLQGQRYTFIVRFRQYG